MFTRLAKQINRIGLDGLIRFGLYIWLFVLPWQTRYILLPAFHNEEFWEYGSVSIYASEVGVLLLLLLASIDITKQKKWSQLLQRVQELFAKKYTWAAGLFVGWLVISILWSPGALVSATRVAHILMSLVAASLMVYYQVSWQRAAAVMIAAGMVQGWLAVGQFLDQSVAPNKWLGIAAQSPEQYGSSVILANNERWLRAYGSFPHPNVLGAFMTLVVMFVMQQLYKATQLASAFGGRFAQRLYWYRVGLYGALVFCMSGLLLSFSRAGWLAAVIGMTIICAYTFVYKRKYWRVFVKAGMIMLATTLLWLSLVPTPFVTRFEAKQPLEKQSYEERVQSYEDSSLVIKGHWFTGTGFGMYTKKLIDEMPGRKIALNQPVHNAWLLVMSEIGIIGLVLFGLLYLYTWLISSDRLWAAVFLTLVAVLMLFDHFWISLVYGNTLLILILYLIMRKNTA